MKDLKLLVSENASRVWSNVTSKIIMHVNSYMEWLSCLLLALIVGTYNGIKCMNIDILRNPNRNQMVQSDGILRSAKLSKYFRNKQFQQN